jgi:hypothetical protein
MARRPGFISSHAFNQWSFLMRFRSSVLVASMALALAGTGSAMAAGAPSDGSSTGSNYTYLDAGYSRIDLNGTNHDANLGTIGGSYDFATGPSGVYAFGAISQGTYTGRFDNVTTGNLGAGYHFPVSSAVDILGQVSYIRIHQRDGSAPFGNVAVGGNSFTANGYQAAVGAHVALNDTWSGQALVGYQDGGRLRGDALANVSVQYAVTPAWSLSVGNTFFNKADANVYQAGIHYKF